MLILSRKKAESIRIGDNILIKVIETRRGLVKLGIEAPPHVRVLRGELTEFATPPAANVTECQTVPKQTHEDMSEPECDDECFHEFLGDDQHEVEVANLMMCVNAH